MNAPFVQFSREVYEAWKRGELSDEELQLAHYVAYETDFRTGELVTTLDAITSELGWNVVATTTGRRLERLRRLGFVETSVRGRRPHHRHVVRPSNRLLRSGQVVQVYAGSPAGTRAGSEPAPDQEFVAPDAATRAGSDAGVEEKRRDIHLPGPGLRDQRGPEEEHDDIDFGSILRDVDRPNGDGPTKCPWCDYVAGNHGGLASHLRQHGKTFSDFWRLEQQAVRA